MLMFLVHRGTAVSGACSDCGAGALARGLPATHALPLNACLPQEPLNPKSAHAVKMTTSDGVLLGRVLKRDERKANTFIKAHARESVRADFTTVHRNPGMRRVRLHAEPKDSGSQGNKVPLAPGDENSEPPKSAAC